MDNELRTYQAEFIEFLLSSAALKFGQFKTKSGRLTPYFVNTGSFDSVEKIAKLGAFYADHINASSLGKMDSLFGPAYKGIPLAVTTSIALFQRHKQNIGFTFDRKEAKDHGEGGSLVGFPISTGSRVAIVEDVITAGLTLRQTIPMLRKMQVEILAIIISVDRCERGAGTLSARQEIEEEFGVNVLPIVTIHQVVNYLSKSNSSGITLDQKIKDDIKNYLEQYGAK